MMKKRGFTLIELMVVVAIIGALLAITVNRIWVMIDRTRERTTLMNLRNIKLAVMLYADTPTGFFYGTSVEWFETALADKFSDGNCPQAMLRNAVKNNQSNTLYCGTSPTTNDGGWMFSTEGVEGKVYINSTEPDTFNVPYSSY
ncbi:MAG: type II secretion system protein [bacterium]